MKLTTSIFLLLAPFYIFAQVDKTSSLYKTIISRDSLLFDIAFNTCDVSQYDNLISDDFEFYHDRSGITATKRDFIENAKNSLCKLSYQPVRKLAKNTMKVYPLEKNGVLYGAIQTGEHDFYALEKDKSMYFTSTATFTHLWVLENNTWKLKRVFSYDHQTARKPIEEPSIFENTGEIEKWIAENHIPAVGIGLIKDGKLKDIKVYGELKKGEPAPYNSIFMVASLTKPITAMIALKLVDQGKWELDEPLHKYWIDPDIKGDPRYKRITTRLILSHQTGFPNWRNNTESKKLTFEFDPGERYQYSGEGFEYLRRALEKKFHKSLDKLADELLIKPLDMKDTRFFWDKTMDESRFANWHDTTGTVYPAVKNKAANAAANLLTTIEDYGKFLVSVMDTSQLSPYLFHEMTKNQTQRKKDCYYGLGFEKYDLGNGEYALSHGGSDPGVNTVFFILPETKEGLIIFTNADKGYRVYAKLLKTYLGKYGQRIIEIETGLPPSQ